MLMIQAAPQQAAAQISQATVITIIVASTAVVLALLWLIGYFASKTPKDKGPLEYGNFFVVVLGIMIALVGFLIVFPLIISGVFTEPTQAIALLSALFGTIVGLVGTYFGVRASSDASKGSQNLASEVVKKPNNGATNDGANGDTPLATLATPANGAATETSNGAAVGARTPAARGTTAEETSRQGARPDPKTLPRGNRTGNE